MFGCRCLAQDFSTSASIKMCRYADWRILGAAEVEKHCFGLMEYAFEYSVRPIVKFSSYRSIINFPNISSPCVQNSQTAETENISLKKTMIKYIS